MVEILKLAGILAFIIVLLRLKWNLGLVLVLASALSGFLFGLPVADMGLAAFEAAIDPLTLRLLAIVLLITFMGEILLSTLQMEGLVRSLGNLFADRRILLPTLPMLIGMLPMVGGALFSAPMVEEASRGLDVGQERKTFINYWFRHAMETVFPLYPSLLVSAALMGVSARTLTLSQWPLLVASLAGGTAFGLLGIRRASQDGSEHTSRRDSLILLARSIWPIALVLTLSLALRIDLIVSLLITVAALVVAHRLNPRQLWSLLRGMSFAAIPIIVGTMVFRNILEASGAIESASAGFATLGIPVYAVVFLVPMLAGFLTGLAVPAFAIGLPIVLPLCGPDVVASGCGILAYAGGWVGFMMSPMHLCLTLTRAYFHADWGRLYRYLVASAFLVLLAASVVVLVRG